MAPRKTSTTKIDPIAVIAIALRGVKTKPDYLRICNANSQADVEAAWQTLSEEQQRHIRQICDSSPQPDLDAIASEIIACGTVIQLQAVKASHGDNITRQAWKLIPVAERVRLKALCDNGQQQVLETVPTEQQLSSDIQIDSFQTISNSNEPNPQPKRTLFAIGGDLLKLSELLDECDDTQQQELINQWLEQLGDERERKLDAYAALISEMQARAEVRKAEAKRMQELAASDENRARLLKDRLKWFFETHNLKTVETARYKLSLAKNGGRQPLIFKDGMSPTELPEHFQKVSIDPNTAAIREALERGEKLDFAQLGERGTSLRIK